MGKAIGWIFIAALLGAFIKFLKNTAPGALDEDKRGRRGKKKHYGLNRAYLNLGA